MKSMTFDRTTFITHTYTLQINDLISYALAIPFKTQSATSIFLGWGTGV